MKIHYRRILPHILPPGESLFITYRLVGPIPTEVLLELTEEKERAIRYIVEYTDTPTDKWVLDAHKRLFARIDTYLDQNADGPHWLKQTDVVAIVKEGLHHRDGADYELHA